MSEPTADELKTWLKRGGVEISETRYFEIASKSYADLEKEHHRRVNISRRSNHIAKQKAGVILREALGEDIEK